MCTDHLRPAGPKLPATLLDSSMCCSPAGSWRHVSSAAQPRIQAQSQSSRVLTSEVLWALWARDNQNQPRADRPTRKFVYAECNNFSYYTRRHFQKTCEFPGVQAMHTVARVTCPLGSNSWLGHGDSMDKDRYRSVPCPPTTRLARPTRNLGTGRRRAL